MYRGHTIPGEVAPHRERQRHDRVQVRAGHRTHEEDDRHHHQAGRHNRRGQTDLPLGVEHSSACGDQHQEKRPQQLGEQPAVGEPRIFKLVPRPELQREPAAYPLLVMRGKAYGYLIGHASPAEV